MLFLIVHIGDERYALDTANVVEIMPLVRINEIPRAPRGVLGVMVYRGRPVPVIDLGEAIAGCPAPPQLSTRIVLVKCAGDAGGDTLVGLAAPRVTQMARYEDADFVSARIVGGGAPFLGLVAAKEEGLVRRVDIAVLTAPFVSLLEPA